MRKMLAGVKSLLRRDDDAAFLAALESGAHTWSALDLAGAAHDAGITAGKAMKLVEGEFARWMADAAGADDWRIARDRALIFAEKLAIKPVGITAESVRQAERILSEKYLQDFDDAAVDIPAIEDLAKALAISDARASEILGGIAMARVQDYIGEMLQDGAIADREDAELLALMVRLGVPSLEFDDITQQTMDAARARWRIMNAALPVIEPPVLLQRGELCHWTQLCEAAEQRSKTVALNYGGPTASIRLMKGIRFRVGSVAVQQVRQEYEHRFGTGTLVFTDRRLIWVGPNKTISFRLDSVIDLETFSNAIEVRRATGKPVRFYYPENQLTAIVAMRLLRAGAFA